LVPEGKGEHYDGATCHSSCARKERVKKAEDAGRNGTKTGGSPRSLGFFPSGESFRNRCGGGEE